MCRMRSGDETRPRLAGWSYVSVFGGDSVCRFSRIKLLTKHKICKSFPTKETCYTVRKLPNSPSNDFS